MVQGVSRAEDALELLEYISACSSLQLRGLAADYGLPKVDTHSLSVQKDWVLCRHPAWVVPKAVQLQ